MKTVNKDVSEIVSENQTYVVWAVYHEDSDVVRRYFVINKVVNKIHSSWGDLISSRAVASDLNKELEQAKRVSL